MRNEFCRAHGEGAVSRLLIASVAALLLAACAPMTVKQVDRLSTTRDNPRILLMPPDIRYYLLTAGGVPEPHAEWTQAAQSNFTAALTEYAASIGSNVTVLDKKNMSPREVDYEELHSAVGFTILDSYFGGATLPSKNGQFDWSLGPDISAIGVDHNADYALFVYYRDYQASGGRVAFAILAAAVGSATNVGSESGFASLVDLQTGDVVWFNVVTSGSGELRQEDGAAAAVRTLFKDIPANTAAE